MLDSTPMSARWGLQKTPAPSQLLAYFLRKQGGDGVFFRSHKDRTDPGAKTLAFFAESDEEAAKMFAAIEVPA